MKNVDTQIIIIDDNIPKDDPIIEELRIEGFKVLLFEVPDVGLRFLKDHLEKRNIVVLDIMFDSSKLDGHKILEKIREYSHLIPVILWSAVNEKKEAFSDFINNAAFAFVKKGARSYLSVVEKVKQANEWLNNSVEGMIEEWIDIRERLQKYNKQPYLIEAEGKSYTLEQLRQEIRQQTPVGQRFIKDLHMLTLDLLLRNKEKLK